MQIIYYIFSAPPAKRNMMDTDHADPDYNASRASAVLYTGSL
jgi:hypothetical protein